MAANYLFQKPQTSGRSGLVADAATEGQRHGLIARVSFRPAIPDVHLTGIFPIAITSPFPPRESALSVEFFNHNIRSLRSKAETHKRSFLLTLGSLHVAADSSRPLQALAPPFTPDRGHEWMGSPAVPFLL